MSATKLFLFGPARSGKSYLARQLAGQGVRVEASPDCYDVVDRHVFIIQAGRPAVQSALRRLGHLAAPCGGGLRIDLGETGVRQ